MTAQRLHMPLDSLLTQLHPGVFHARLDQVADSGQAEIPTYGYADG